MFNWFFLGGYPNAHFQIAWYPSWYCFYPWWPEPKEHPRGKWQNSGYCWLGKCRVVPWILGVYQGPLQCPKLDALACRCRRPGFWRLSWWVSGGEYAFWSSRSFLIEKLIPVSQIFCLGWSACLPYAPCGNQRAYITNPSWTNKFKFFTTKANRHRQLTCYHRFHNE